MSHPKILRIPVLPFGMLNAHLVLGDRGAVLVDAGLPGSASKIVRALRAEGLAPRDLRLIVVTHAHVDHAGGAAEVRAQCGAPILGHAADVRHFRGEAPMKFCATGLFGRLFLRTGLIQRPYPPFTPDIVLREGAETDLEAFGIHGSVRHTPGHTAGSISMTVGDAALVGDLLASGLWLGGIARVGTAKSPPFEDDPWRVGGELQMLVGQGARRFHLGHGGPLGFDEVARHAARLRHRSTSALGDGAPTRRLSSSHSRYSSARE
jgi:glyoxylase-like metal-dependent hydrolase (beta-lactamase superfamily II)